MRLYWSLGSQPARAVKTVIDIGHIPVSLISIAVLKKQHQTAQFLKMYPMGRIPVLVDDDFVLGQSCAIISYLCQKYPVISSLEGNGIRQRGLVNQCVGWYQSTFRQALFRPFRRYLAFAYSNQPFYQQQRDQLMSTMNEAIQKFQEIMSKKNELYVAGNNLTYADFLFYYELTNLRYFQMEIQQSWIKEWSSRVHQLQQVKKIDIEWEKIALQRAKAFSQLELPSKGHQEQ